MTDKNVKKTVVPWLSMQEWQQAYKDLYSEDVQARTRGYELLLVWRARVPVLPASIECTLGLVQVCLRDRNVVPEVHSGKLPAYVEHDLRLMYSTSIMRFLNHLSSIAQNVGETLYKMAKRLYLPEWLVSLRHDTAHGFNLPALELLRPAALIALDWLREHYWKCEGQSTSDLVVKESPNTDVEEVLPDLTELMDTWQALKLHVLGGFNSVADLPDDELRSYVQEVLGESHKEGVTLRSVVSLLFKRLMSAVKKLKSQAVLQELVELIISQESFIPSPSCMQLISDSLNVRPDKDRLPTWLFDLWRELFTPLQTSRSLLPLMVCELLNVVANELEASHRRLTASLWIQALCRGLEKGRQLLDRVKQFERQRKNPIRDRPFKKTSKLKNKKIHKQPPKLSRKAAWTLIKCKLVEEDPGWKNVFCLGLDGDPLSICSKDTMKEAVLKPNAYTHLFLPSLLELMEPPLPQTVKQNLVSLVRIYTTSPDVEQADDSPVHTVEELQEAQPETMEADHEPAVETETRIPTPPEAVASWERCEDGEQWASCPLGLLPWQRDKVPTFNLPKDISWQSLEPVGTFAQEMRPVPGLFREKIDWSTSAKKRPKRRGLKQRRRLGAKCVLKALRLMSGPKAVR